MLRYFNIYLKAIIFEIKNPIIKIPAKVSRDIQEYFTSRTDQMDFLLNCCLKSLLVSIVTIV